VEVCISGLRRCAITTASPKDFLVVGPKWAELSLTAMPLEIQQLSQYSSASTPGQPAPGRPYVFRFALGDPKSVAQFKIAWDSGANEEIAVLLGYPGCCYRFFHQICVEQAFTDPTWAMGLNGGGVRSAAGVIDVKSSHLTNILWRWMGVRSVFHSPCSFHCHATEQAARLLLELGSNLGYQDEMEWMSEILSWPIEWSALHGIAEIKLSGTQVRATRRRGRAASIFRIGDLNC
jgi:hypothetical protein